MTRAPQHALRTDAAAVVVPLRDLDAGSVPVAGGKAANLGELLTWARANPAKATYGVPIAGGPTHFLGVMLARAAACEMHPIAESPVL